MAKRSSRITIDGVYESGVLGIYRIIRGFADLGELAEISSPFEMADAPDGRVQGHQRAIDDRHADEIKRYLEKSSHRFFPEVILSVRTNWEKQDVKEARSKAADGIRIKRKYKSPKIPTHEVSIEIAKLKEILAARKIRRIDGNHRLARAGALHQDPGIPGKYRAPFCLILLGPETERADDYAESIIFHTLNSTAIPVNSEHALRLLLGQDRTYAGSDADECAREPALHFTRLLRDRIEQLPASVHARLTPTPLSRLHVIAKEILALRPEAGKSLEALRRFSRSYFDGVFAILPRLEETCPRLLAAPYALEVISRIWLENEKLSPQEREAMAVRKLTGFGQWLEKAGLLELAPGMSFADQLIKVYAGVQRNIPRTVFLARWYPGENETGEVRRAAEMRLDQIRRALEDLRGHHQVHLELIDMGTEPGGTRLIPAKMYEAIATSDVMLVDLTGVRPNVCIEAGYALHKWPQDRLIFIYQARDDHDQPPFDLTAFKYLRIREAAQIPGELVRDLKAIVEACVKVSGI